MKALSIPLIIIGSVGILAGTFFFGYSTGYDSCKKKVLTKADSYWKNGRKD